MSTIILLLAASIIVTVSAQLSLKKGILEFGKISFPMDSTDVFGTIFQLAQNVWIVLGLFLFGVSFILWIFILSRFQLSIAYPVVVSLNFSLIAIGSWLFFQEYLSGIQIMGIIVIIIGVFLTLPKGI